MPVLHITYLQHRRSLGWPIQEVRKIPDDIIYYRTRSSQIKTKVMNPGLQNKSAAKEPFLDRQRTGTCGSALRSTLYQFPAREVGYPTLCHISL